jgi:hypothetical protein
MPDLETPDADAAEQQQAVAQPAVEETGAQGGGSPLEADEGDLAESSIEVPLDEDDWR